MTTRLKQKLTYLLTYLLLSPTQIIEGGQALGPLWIDALKGNGNQVCLDESWIITHYNNNNVIFQHSTCSWLVFVKVSS